MKPDFLPPEPVNNDQIDLSALPAPQVTPEVTAQAGSSAATTPTSAPDLAVGAQGATDQPTQPAYPPAQPVFVPVAPGYPYPENPTTYPQMWRTPAWRGWRPIVAFVVGLITFVLVLAIIPTIGIIVDISSGRYTADEFMAGIQQGKMDITPAIFIANNIGLAALIPLSYLWGKVFFKQRAGFLSSVIGKFRWNWFGRLLLVLAPFWIITNGIDIFLALNSGELELMWGADSVVLLAGVLLTTPLQCVGEEYAMRGFFNRTVASFLTHPIAAPMLGAVVSSLIFVAAHVASDPLLNLFYFLFGMVACWMTWRTGGLEAAAAMHIVNNLTALSLAPFTDISEMFNREAGVATPVMMISTLIPMVLGVIMVEFMVRRHPELVRNFQPGIENGNSIAS